MDKENMKNVRAKKISPEENLYDLFTQKYKECASRENTVYHVCMTIVSIAVMILLMFWINNKYGVSGIDAFVSFLDWRIIVLMLSVFILIKIVESVSLFISFYHKSRYIDFGKLYRANAIGDYFGKVYRSVGRQAFIVGYMADTRIKPVHLLRVTAEKRYFNLVASLGLSLIMIIVGAFLWTNEMNVIVTIITFVAVIVGVGYLLYIYMSKNDKAKSISISMFLSRLLAKLGLTKDEEKTYYNMIDKTLVVNKSRKIKWYAKVLDVLSQVTTLALRGLILYLIFSLVGYSDVEFYFKSLWLILIFDIVKFVVPLPNDIILIDLILFGVLLVAVEPQYIWFILVLYELFENWVKDIHYLLVVVIDNLFFKKKNSVVIGRK